MDIDTYESRKEILVEKYFDLPEEDRSSIIIHSWKTKTKYPIEVYWEIGVKKPLYTEQYDGLERSPKRKVIIE